MGSSDTLRHTVRIDDDGKVSALVTLPTHAHACYVIAHGAGAGMEHPFMAAMAAALDTCGVATFRFQFPYMERGSRRPDSPKVAQAAVRAAVREAARCCATLPMFAGGKSFGGRMTSQAQAADPLPGILGLAFLGFPLHPAGKPSTARAMHLGDIDIPMRFFQGTRDKLAEIPLLTTVIDALGEAATLSLIDGADHGFHVLKRSGRTDEDIIRMIATDLAAWTKRIAQENNESRFRG